VLCRTSYSNSVFRLAVNSLAHDNYRLKHVGSLVQKAFLMCNIFLVSWCLNQNTNDAIISHTACCSMHCRRHSTVPTVSQRNSRL